jgi:predicted dehydrogenase
MVEQKTVQNGISRRHFITTTAAAALYGIIPGKVRGNLKEQGATSKLNIAGIGVGGMGGSNLRNLEDENIIALCDVDPDYAAKTINRYPQAVIYKDFRVMLEKQKDIDAVVIATPDHTHALIAMAAIKAGKHVYCQKPLTHDIYESRRLAEAARESKVSTVMGIQAHSAEGIRLICEWIWDGAIGEVREVDAWCSLSYYPWGHAYWSSKWGDHRPEDTPSVPENLNWDLWIGPAPLRPYHPAYHPMVWRCWWDFGCGMMGDRGVHTLDSVNKALKLGYPSSVAATTLGGNEETHPLAATVTYLFPARDEMPPLKLNWYEGIEPPWPSALEAGRSLPKEGGVIFKGDKGSIMCGVYGDSPRLIPESAMQAYKGTEKILPRVEGKHEQDWAYHCKQGTQPLANFEYSAALTELTLLGNIAKRFPGQLLLWDGPNMSITNLPEANQWVKRPYRQGWVL